MFTYSLTIDAILDMTMAQVNAIIESANKRTGPSKAGNKVYTKEFNPTEKQQTAQDRALNERLQWRQKQR